MSPRPTDPRSPRPGEPQPEEKRRDDRLGAALSDLPVPDHGPTFWADLTDRLSEPTASPHPIRAEGETTVPFPTESGELHLPPPSDPGPADPTPTALPADTDDQPGRDQRTPGPPTSTRAEGRWYESYGSRGPIMRHFEIVWNS